MVKSQLVAYCISVIIGGALLAGCGVGGGSAGSWTVAGGGAPTRTASPLVGQCQPTVNDGVSPTYKPESPVRSTVGHGHVLTGIVESSQDCSPIAGAKLELWPEYVGRGHPDQARATVFTNDAGRYRFESELPEHIHMQISAAGYLTIGQNSYHPDGRASGEFDIVLRPISR